MVTKVSKVYVLVGAKVGGLVGKTEVCSECGKQKKIELTLQQGKNKVKVTRLENGYRIT